MSDKKPQTLTEAIAILQEVKKRKGIDFLNDGFDSQNNFIKDPARLKSALCTRRSGKSYGAGKYLFKSAQDFPGTKQIYVALTRDSAKRIMWNDVLKVLIRKHSIPCKTNETELSITLDNGSIIYCLGADAGPDEMEKMLGQKYKLVIIDEAGSFRQNLRTLVYDVLEAATIDLDGTICLIGTPKNLTKSLFYDVTTGKEKGWSNHKWSAFDNPFIKDQWAKMMEVIVERNPGVIDTPLYKQNYLGEWFIDVSKLVYKFDQNRNVYDKLETVDKLYYVLGIDLGYDDDSSFVVCAYTDYAPTLYVIESWKKQHMTITHVAEKINEISSRLEITKFIIDGANKQAVEEIKSRYNIPLESADKQGKADFIEIMNADFITGKIMLHESSTDLMSEYAGLVWDERSVKRVEHPLCPNHLADACLYAWRFCYNYNSRPKLQRPKLNTEQAIDDWFERESERVENNKELAFWEKDF